MSIGPVLYSKISRLCSSAAVAYGQCLRFQRAKRRRRCGNPSIDRTALCQRQFSPYPTRSLFTPADWTSNNGGVDGNVPDAVRKDREVTLGQETTIDMRDRQG